MLMIILQVSPGDSGSVQSFSLSPTTQLPQQGGSLRWTITEAPPVSSSHSGAACLTIDGQKILKLLFNAEHLQMDRIIKEKSLPSCAKYSKCLNLLMKISVLGWLCQKTETYGCFVSACVHFGIREEYLM